MNEDQQAPKIEFPCAYPLKIIATARESLISEVLGVLRPHLPDLSADDITIHDSSKARFVSLRFTITAQSEAQIIELFTAIKTLKDIHMVL